MTALKLIDRLGLYNTVFTDPTKEVPNPNSSEWSIAYNLLSVLRDSQTPGSIYHLLVRSEDARFQAWILAALVPWGMTEKIKIAGGKAIDNEPYITDVARKGIALDSKTCSIISGAYENRKEIIDLKDAIDQAEPWSKLNIPCPLLCYLNLLIS